MRTHTFRNTYQKGGSGELHRPPIYPSEEISGLTVDYNDLLGSGTFGWVYGGYYDTINDGIAENIKVAVKIFKEYRGYQEGIQGFVYLNERDYPQEYNHFLTGGKVRDVVPTRNIDQPAPFMERICGWKPSPTFKYAIVLKFIPGENAFIVSKKYKLGWFNTLIIIRSVLTKLIVLHQCELVHRDIKLDNIMVDLSTGNAELVDWDMAEPSYDIFFAMGASPYIAPDIFAIDGVSTVLDGRPSDMYSIGVVMFIMIYKILPWVRQRTEIEKERGTHYPITDILKNEISWPRVPVTAEDAIIRPIIEDLLQTDPTKRPTAQKLYDKLQVIIRRHKTDAESPVDTSVEYRDEVVTGDQSLGV